MPPGGVTSTFTPRHHGTQATTPSTHETHLRAAWASRVRSRGLPEFREYGRPGSTCPCHHSARARSFETRPAHNTGLPLLDYVCRPRFAQPQTRQRDAPREREQRRPRRRNHAHGFDTAAGGVRGSGQTLGPIPRRARAEHCRPPGTGGTWRIGASLGCLGRA